MTRRILFIPALLILFAFAADGEDPAYEVPRSVGTFPQQYQLTYTSADGLPSDTVTSIRVTGGGVVAETESGWARLDDGAWAPASEETIENPADAAELSDRERRRLNRFAGTDIDLRGVAAWNGEVAVAADTGLYVQNDRKWALALPQDGEERWAPVDVRAVVYDGEGRLWFACPQGVGYRVADGEWRLFTGFDGLPFNDFTCAAAGTSGVWFGTTNGAIRYTGTDFEFRQGRRWLLDNHVNAIAIDADGGAWIATNGGVSCIATKPMTLAEKAKFYEDEIDTYHRRTPFGYVCPARMTVPGDKSTAVPYFTDNDGHFTGLYLGAVSLGYAATGDPEMREEAKAAFKAVAFLSEVTQGGPHAAPKGFVARNIVPTDGPDPNEQFDLEYDLRRNQRDKLWKIIQPRLPVDETGEWYWKNDSSPDELDGHYFGFALYFDHVCETEEEKDEVRKVARRIIDHVIDHGYNQVDYDGKPTRWGHYSPDDMNRNPAWVVERGLNCYSILTFLSITHHITGDPKYRREYLKLAYDHGYGMNGMTQPRDFTGRGSHGQPDDNMAFMNYYHLIRYETDPTLLSMYYRAIRTHWSLERCERNAFENFVYGACCFGKTRIDQWGADDLTPPESWLDDTLLTLKNYPIDMVDWPLSNAHRTDMVPLLDHVRDSSGAGYRVDNYVFPIAENHALYWGDDPWVLNHKSDGTRLREGVPFLLAYYMGKVHGFITD